MLHNVLRTDPLHLSVCPSAAARPAAQERVGQGPRQREQPASRTRTRTRTQTRRRGSQERCWCGCRPAACWCCPGPPASTGATASPPARWTSSTDSCCRAAAESGQGFTVLLSLSFRDRAPCASLTYRQGLRPGPIPSQLLRSGELEIDHVRMSIALFAASLVKSSLVCLSVCPYVGGAGVRLHRSALEPHQRPPQGLLAESQELHRAAARRLAAGRHRYRPHVLSLLAE